MVNTSAQYKTDIKARTREWHPRVVFATAAGTLTDDGSGIIQGTLKVRETIGDGMSLGGAAMAEFSVSILDGGDAVRANLNGGRATPSAGLKLTSGNIEYIPLGVFVIDEARKKKPNITEIHGFDNMSKAERPFNLVPITYPTTIGAIYHAVTLYCGIIEETTDLPDFAATVNTAPSGDFSCRDIIGYIAQRSHRIARMTRADGKLELVEVKAPQFVTAASIDGNAPGSADGGDFSGAQTPDIDGGAVPENTPDATTDASFRFTYKADDAPVIFTGVAYTMPNEETGTQNGPEVLLYGQAQHAVDITENPLLFTGTRAEFDALAESLADYIKSAKYQPFDMNYPGDPAIQAGDMISNTDREGIAQRSVAATVEFTPGGKCRISATGKSDSEAGYKTNTQKIGNTIATLAQASTNRKSQMEIATQTAAALIAGMSGGYFINGDDIPGGLHAGNIYISDAANINEAVKVWRMNQAGMGYSDNGIAGPFVASITADGQIVARLITADMIRTGNLQALSGASFFDLDNGRIAARSTAGAATLEAIESSFEYGGSFVEQSVERAAWYDITPDQGGDEFEGETWGEDPTFEIYAGRNRVDYGEWVPDESLTVSGDVDFSNGVTLWEGAESAGPITLANGVSLRGLNSGGSPVNLVGLSSAGNTVYNTVNQHKFYIGTTCVGYIDGSGFHNGAP